MIECYNNSQYERTCFNVNIAGIETEIHTVYPSSYFYCQQYLSDGIPTIRIEVTAEEIKSEIDEGKEFFYTCTEYIGEQNKKIVLKETNESRTEISIVYRKFVEAVLDYNRIFMHGAVISAQNQAIMFTAPSGTGKTTHIMKWLQKLDGAFVVNGDKPIIEITNNDVTAYGTPWCGKEKLGMNTKARLKNIVLMERNDKNRIEEISFGQAYPFLLQQTYLPREPEKAKKTLKLLNKLYQKVHIYRFQFNNFEDDCFEVAYHGILRTKE